MFYIILTYAQRTISKLPRRFERFPKLPDGEYDIPGSRGIYTPFVYVYFKGPVVASLERSLSEL